MQCSNRKTTFQLATINWKSTVQIYVRKCYKRTFGNAELKNNSDREMTAKRLIQLCWYQSPNLTFSML
jgi:hypothetical protein